MIYEYETFILNQFKFENGEILENVAVEYIAKGKAKYDKTGNISNMLIFCHGFEGNATSINDFHQLTSKGMPLDYNNYLIISIASLGFPNSSCPSQTGLNNNFPKYTVKDNVNFKRQFIKEKYNQNNVLGIIGSGIGGYEIYTWACEYPDDMEFIIVGNSSFKTSGYRYAVSSTIKSIIEDNEAYHLGEYDESFTKTMINVYKILYSQYFSKNTLEELSNDQIDILIEDFVEKRLFTNIYDFKYQYD